MVDIRQFRMHVSLRFSVCISFSQVSLCEARWKNVPFFAGCLFTICRLAVGERTGWRKSPVPRHSGIRPRKCVMVWNKMSRMRVHGAWLWSKLSLTGPSEQCGSAVHVGLHE